MRRPLPIRMYIPAEALLIISSEKRNRNPELYVYIIYSLTINSNIYKNRSDYKCSEGYAPLNHDNFFKLSGKKSQSFISFLKKNCIIEDDNIKIPKKKRYYFRINPNFFPNEFQKASIFELTSDTKLFHNLVNEHRKSNSNFCKLPNHLSLMQKKFFKIIYNNTQAEDWVFKNVTDVNKMYSYLNSINQFYDKRFRYFKRNKTNNRLDTNLTNLKKELRNFIVGNYVSIDLKNSQPFFLAILILYLIILSFKNKMKELEGYKKGISFMLSFFFF